MKTKICIIVALFFGLLVATSCGSSKTDGSSEQKSEEAVSVDFSALVHDWSKANSDKDIKSFDDLYNEDILYYGTQMKKGKCIDSKQSFFKKSPDFYQQIYGEVEVEKISETEVKCSFVKRVTLNGSTTDYPSYLNFVKIGDEWKISVEGDLVTDKNLAKRAEEKSKNFVEGKKVNISGKYDFNGDGKMETCYLVAPKTFDDEDSFGECDGDCGCYINFSDENIPSIYVKSYIGGTPDILGDLDGNGTCEIGIWPAWWTSCWHEYYVYTFANGKWQLFVNPITAHCDLMEELDAYGKHIIEPISGKKDTYLIHYSDMDEVDIVSKTRIEKKRQWN